METKPKIILDQLKLINKRLENLELDIKEIKKDANDVAKYVPFVDSLSKIGTITAIGNIKEMFEYFNPKNLLIQKDIDYSLLKDEDL